MTNAIFSIAKKEVTDNFRNYEVIALAVVFAITPIMISYASADSHGWGSIETTIMLMQGFMIFLIPLIGLLLGYATIIGEIEKGSMGALLSHPVKRDEVILGKLVGLGSVIWLTLFIGLGFAGSIIIFNTFATDYILYLIFIATSILLGLVFMSMSLAFSSFVKTTSTATSMAIGIWFFFTMGWQFIILAINVALGGRSAMPDWAYSINLLNPIIAYSYVGSSDPKAPSVYWIVLSFLIWLIFSVLVSFLLFRKREV